MIKYATKTKKSEHDGKIHDQISAVLLHKFGGYYLLASSCSIARCLANDHNYQWYNKEDNATFSDVLAYVKRLILIGKTNYFKSASNDEFIKIRRQDLEILINNGFMAA